MKDEGELERIRLFIKQVESNHQNLYLVLLLAIIISAISLYNMFIDTLEIEFLRFFSTFIFLGLLVCLVVFFRRWLDRK